MYWAPCLEIIPGLATGCGTWWGGCNRAMLAHPQRMHLLCGGLDVLLLRGVKTWLGLKTSTMSICHGSFWRSSTDYQDDPSKMCCSSGSAYFSFFSFTVCLYCFFHPSTVRPFEDHWQGGTFFSHVTAFVYIFFNPSIVRPFEDHWQGRAFFLM